ncbi:MAG: Ig-like domain-containing protein [Pirellulales bacterium]|nr:Ig-like domain-containing protein [Pirellulales bacterium]
MKRTCIILACVLPIFIAGCGPDGPKLVPVEGAVTFNGRPLADTLIEFQPDDPMASPSSGVTDADGHYVLQFDPERYGAMPGMHTVTISTENENTGKREILPPKYNTQTELKREVKDETNVIDFPLESVK